MHFTSNEAILNLLQNFFIVSASITIGKSLIITMYNKITFRKASKYNGCLIKECTFIDNVSIEKRKNQIEQKNLDVLLPLVEKLSNYTSNENLKTVYRNLTSLKIKKRKTLFLGGLGGLYDSKNNTIEYSLIASLGHEFLHLASSYYNPETKEAYSGFAQKIDNIIIGKGLNEGYTELLASRIYNKKNKVRSYKLDVEIAKLLELFFDNPKEMEKLYFNHDLLGFVKHMEKFASKKEIVNLILEIDSAHNHATIDPLNPFILYTNIKIQLKLYKLFVTKNTDIEKLKQFTNLICENKSIYLFLNNNKMKLYRENPYIHNNNSATQKKKQKK